MLFSHFGIKLFYSFCFLLFFFLFRERTVLKMDGAKKKVTIVGSGNWGSAISRIIGTNVANSDEFDSTVRMYVYEELINGEKLSEIINKRHENVKYLPGSVLPNNVVAVADMAKAIDDADVLVFVFPHQFLHGICNQMKAHVKKGAIGVTLIKGVDCQPDQDMRLISSVIADILQIDCCVLMGANLANEVAKELFCEATVGCHDLETGYMLKRLFQTNYFRLVVSMDAAAVELCGALKNIIATGTGFTDGLGYGNNTKAAVIRLGTMEMIRFVQDYHPKTQWSTFFESCGIADVITTCLAGRNMTVAKAYAQAGGARTIAELEAELLNGQKLQGVLTAAEVNQMLKSRNLEEKYPLFTAVHEIAIGKRPVDSLIDCLRNHPEHM